MKNPISVGLVNKGQGNIARVQNIYTQTLWFEERAKLYW
jgi:hypothetical protein